MDGMAAANGFFQKNSRPRAEARAAQDENADSQVKMPALRTASTAVLPDPSELKKENHDSTVALPGCRPSW
jgi:hypothetical protein